MFGAEKVKGPATGSASFEARIFSFVKLKSFGRLKLLFRTFSFIEFQHREEGGGTILVKQNRVTFY